MQYFKTLIPLVKPHLPPAELLIPQLEKVIYSGYIAEGEQVIEFEKLLAGYLHNKFTLSVSSGTAALHLALIMAGVKPGDEVISTPLTAEPTNMAILQAGGKFVWADIDERTGTLDPGSVKTKITPRTKAIMIVHYAGVPANITDFSKISRETGIPVIEDAAHALGAKFDGKMIGCHSPYVIFSFQAIKHITTGDGGAISVASEDTYNKIRLKRWFGIDKNIPRSENNIKCLGYKYHMNNISATIGIAQMRQIDEVIDRHIENGKFYDEALNNIPGIELLAYYPGSEPSYWLYTLKAERKADFIRCLTEHNISASQLHVRNDRHAIFGGIDHSLENTNSFFEKFIHIPCGWWVGKEEREYIADVIKKGW